MYDIIVLGCGIAGASFANFASKNGKKILIIDTNYIKDSASIAAGAFLSPKFGPKSNYNDFINRAFIYSIDFYNKNYQEFLDARGMLRIPRNNEEILSCKEYAKNSNFWKEGSFNGFNGYFCIDGATIQPLPIILKMIAECDVEENEKEVVFKKDGDFWQVNEHRSKHLVLATGAKLTIKNEPYIKIKHIFGQRIEANVKNGYDIHIHRSSSVSAFKDGRVLVGATHIPSWRYEDSEELFKTHREKLINEANSLLNQEIEVVGIKGGFRSSTTDYFPLVGNVIDSLQTLKTFPLLRHGVKVEEARFKYYDNLWLHTGHGARGFVLAPYTARELYYQMFDKEKVTESEITLARQLIRHARKMKD